MRYTTVRYLPELEEPERSFIERLTTGMSDPDLQQFATAYRLRRKDPQTVLLMAVVGVVAVPGLHRFALGQVGMGFLYLLTYGLLLLGTITDIVKHKELTFKYNRQVAWHITNNLFHSGSRVEETAAPAGDRGLLSRKRQA